MMSDSLLYEPVGVDHLLDNEPRLHAQLADCLGRIGDPRALPDLQRLLQDQRSEVRRSAAFAMGILGEREAASALLGAVVDEDREVGRLAIEALARLKEPFGQWSSALAALPESERHARLLPALFRLPIEVMTPWFQVDDSALSASDKRWILYAAARRGGPLALPLLRLRLEDEDPWVRGWAARGLGRLGDGSDLQRLLPLLDDAEPGPVIQSLRAGARIVADGRGAAPRDWLLSLRQRLADNRPGVRLTAIEVAGYWLQDEELEADLMRHLDTGAMHEKELALLAMVRGRARRAEELTLRAALAPASTLRAAAAKGAGELGLGEVLEILGRDPQPSVRLAVLEALLGDDSSDRSKSARRALRDIDPAVRAAALGWLAQAPSAPIEEILTATRGPEAGRLPGLAVNGVRALAARSAEPLERGAVIAALEELARSEEFLVRREAAQALEDLGRERPAVGWIDAGVGHNIYEDSAARLEEEQGVSLETSKGTMILALACREAPLTCTSFLQLVNQGFYDGLEFHRVVPDFVVQAGDPRGDGWGGPGYSLRDESTRLRFDRGVIGMARSGHHTAGSQFFITLSSQPHLDGTYTAFGRVTAGGEALDELVQGDRIIRMRGIRGNRPRISTKSAAVDFVR
jgi:cyclophilin family peptidyl-prolyl cis-trans isomerase